MSAISSLIDDPPRRRKSAATRPQPQPQPSSHSESETKHPATMIEDAPTSKARVLVTETIVTETIVMQPSHGLPTFTEQAQQQSQPQSLKSRVESKLAGPKRVWERIKSKLPSVSKEHMRWLLVLASLLLALLVMALKARLAPSQSHSIMSHIWPHSQPLGDEWTSHGANLQHRVHDTLKDVRSAVKGSYREAKNKLQGKSIGGADDSNANAESHYHKYPDQYGGHQDEKERSAQVLQALHSQARRLGVEDPTEVHYHELHESPKQTVQYFNAKLKDAKRVEKSKATSDGNLGEHEGEREGEGESEGTESEREHASAKQRHQEKPSIAAQSASKPIVSEGEKVEAVTEEPVPTERRANVFMDTVHSLSGRFTHGLNEIRNVLDSHKQAPEEHRPSLNERAHTLLQQLEEMANEAKGYTESILPSKKTLLDEPTSWLRDKLTSAKHSVFGMSEQARHQAAKAREEARHEAQKLHEAMKHQLRVLELDISQMPRYWKKAARHVAETPMEALEHMA